MQQISGSLNNHHVVTQHWPYLNEQKTRVISKFLPIFGTKFYLLPKMTRQILVLQNIPKSSILMLAPLVASSGLTQLKSHVM